MKTWVHSLTACNVVWGQFMTMLSLSKNCNFLVGHGLVDDAEVNIFWSMQINLKQRNVPWVNFLSHLWTQDLFHKKGFTPSIYCPPTPHWILPLPENLSKLITLPCSNFLISCQVVKQVIQTKMSQIVEKIYNFLTPSPPPPGEFDELIFNSPPPHQPKLGGKNWNVDIVAPPPTLAKTAPKSYQTDTWVLFYSYISHKRTKCCIYLTNISPIYPKNQGHISVIWIWEKYEECKGTVQNKKYHNLWKKSKRGGRGQG